MKPIISLLAFAICNSSIYAQRTAIPENQPSILELSRFLQNQNTEEGYPGNESSSGQKIGDLLHKLQPSVYFFGGTAKVYGENPTTLFTDINSLEKIKNSSFEIRHIKIVRIKINLVEDLNSTIDLSVFSNFKDLQYIYIISGITATEQDFRAMIRNSENKFSIFYRIDKGDSDK